MDFTHDLKTPPSYTLPKVILSPHLSHVLSNLLRPFLLARFSAGLTATTVVLVGLVIGWRVLRYFKIGRTSEGQLALERRAELVATLVEVALAATILGLLLSLVAADRMTSSIRGAMCAWGVLDASPWGFRSLGISVLAALGCTLFIVIHRLDLRLHKPTLTRAKFAALFAVAPLVLADFVAVTAYTLDLDLRVTASCCSTGLDRAVAMAGADGGGPREIAVLVFVTSTLLAIAIAWLGRTRPSKRKALTLASVSFIASLSALPSIVWWVAPHVYETPTHLCPFCLFHPDAFGIGWALFPAWFAATALGLSSGLVGALERPSGEPHTVRHMQAQLSWATAMAWTWVLFVSLAPVVRWSFVSGGASLFGT